MKALGTSVVATLLIGLATGANGEESYTLHDYATDCAELIAEAPVFDCQSLDLIPITVDGETPDSYSRNMTCDRPAMLPYPDKDMRAVEPPDPAIVGTYDDIQPDTGDTHR